MQSKNFVSSFAEMATVPISYNLRGSSLTTENPHFWPSNQN